MVTSYQLTTQLTQLHERHVWRLNDAVHGGATDQTLQRLSDDYTDSALHLMADALATGVSGSR